MEGKGKEGGNNRKLERASKVFKKEDNDESRKGKRQGKKKEGEDHSAPIKAAKRTLFQ